MTDPQAPFTGDNPTPHWVAAPTPWSAEPWPTGPTPPPAWPGYGWQPPGPAQPPAPPAPQPGRAGSPRIAIGVVAMLIAALIGVGIGSQLHRRTSAPAAALAPVPSAPAPGFSPTTPPASSSSSPATGTAAQASAIAARVNPAIVDVNTQLGYQNGAGAGTGMILTSTGEILTNNHVVDGATSISVTLVATGRSYPATVVGTDPTEDIAVIQIKGVSGLRTIQTSDAVAVGDPVVAIGNAGGVGGTPAVASGNIQALNQTITAADRGGANAETLNGLIQIDAPIQAGDSGGPLVNSSAQVIGIDTAASSASRFRGGGTVGFAIPIGHAKAIAAEIEAGHASSTIHIGLPGFLGVGIGSSTGGAVVTSVQAGSPAAGAKLAAGDTITSLDGHAIDSARTLSTLTRARHPGDKVSLGWSDQSGQSHSATVTLATGPAD